jgi:hypothetical protein
VDAQTGGPQPSAGERDDANPPVRRPDPARWLWYALGGRLPRRYRSWVLRDVTSRAWVARHLLRALVQVAPVVAVLLLVVPGTPSIRMAAVTGGLLLGLLYSGAYVQEIAEHRVHQAGYPVGTAQSVRNEADSDRRREQADLYARTWRVPPIGAGTAGGHTPGSVGPPGATPGPTAPPN